MRYMAGEEIKKPFYLQFISFILSSFALSYILPWFSSLIFKSKRAFFDDPEILFNLLTINSLPELEKLIGMNLWQASFILIAVLAITILSYELILLVLARYLVPIIFRRTKS